MTELLGFEVVDERGRPRRGWRSTATSRASHRRSLHTPDAPPAVNGLGTVHHVAMAVADRRRAAARSARRCSRAGARSPRSWTASTSSRSTSASRAACCSRSRRCRPGFTVDEALAELGPRAEAAAVGRAEPARYRSRPADGPVRHDNRCRTACRSARRARRRGARRGRAAVIMVHGRGAGPHNILDLVRSRSGIRASRISRPRRRAAPGIRCVPGAARSERAGSVVGARSARRAGRRVEAAGMPRAAHRAARLLAGRVPDRSSSPCATPAATAA